MIYKKRKPARLISLKDIDSQSFERQRLQAIEAQVAAARKGKIERYFRRSLNGGAVSLEARLPGKIIRYRQEEMPEAEFRRQFHFLKNCGVDIVRSLAGIFSVPPEQIKIRCAQLELEP